MARLTPLSKGLLAIIVLGGLASLAWNLVLNDPSIPRFMDKVDKVISRVTARDSTPSAPPATAPATPSPAVVPAPAPAAPTPPSADTTPGKSVAALTEEGRALAAAGDFAKARGVLAQAVTQGSGAAACMLGDMLTKGQGGPVDSPRAAELFRLAQERGSLCFGN